MAIDSILSICENRIMLPIWNPLQVSLRHFVIICSQHAILKVDDLAFGWDCAEDSICGTPFWIL